MAAGEMVPSDPIDPRRQTVNRRGFAPPGAGGGQGLPAMVYCLLNAGSEPAIDHVDERAAQHQDGGQDPEIRQRPLHDLLRIVGAAGLEDEQDHQDDRKEQDEVADPVHAVFSGSGVAAGAGPAAGAGGGAGAAAVSDDTAFASRRLSITTRLSRPTTQT